MYFGAALALREDPGGIICFGARVEGSLKCRSCSPPPHCGLALARQPERNWWVYLFPFHSGTDELGAYWMTCRAHVTHSWVACCSIVWHMRCENCQLFGQYSVLYFHHRWMYFWKQPVTVCGWHFFLDDFIVGFKQAWFNYVSSVTVDELNF